MEQSCKVRVANIQVLSPKEVEVTMTDGEDFRLFSPIGVYSSEEYRNYHLPLIEGLFNKHYTSDRADMIAKILTLSHIYALNILGVRADSAQEERTRIGARIREIRQECGIEARELAQLVGIDASNLSKIENGKYSAGLDVLSKIAFALGKKIDFVNL